jgi:hypothetical protein
MSVILALGRLRDHEFEASQSNLARPCFKIKTKIKG